MKKELSDTWITIFFIAVFVLATSAILNMILDVAIWALR